MSAFSIVPFSWAHVPAITAIYRHYVENTVITFDTEPPGESAMAERLGHILALGHPLLVAEAGGITLGYAYASVYRPRPGYRHTCENAIYLTPEATGRGLGSALMKALIEKSRALGFRQMIAVITADSTASIRLHERFGFREVGRYKAVGYKFDRWLDIIHLQRALEVDAPVTGPAAGG